MPKDEWAKARRRDLARKLGREKVARHPKKPAHFSPKSRLWFGKYRNHQIDQIPRDYLKWLVGHFNHQSLSPPMPALLTYLRGFLSASQTPMVPRPSAPTRKPQITGSGVRRPSSTYQLRPAPLKTAHRHSNKTGLSESVAPG